MIRNANSDSRNASLKPCIWPASSGPLFLKSVWMDRDRQGYRHFILNTDWTKTNHHHHDQIYRPPKTHRPKQLEPLERRHFQTTATTTTTTTSLKSTEATTATSSNKEQLRRQLTLNSSVRLNRKLCHTKSKDSHSASVLKKDLLTSAIGKAKGKRASVTDRDQLATDFYVNPEENYQLTERVLQWLDLAGKTSVGTDESACVTVNTKPSKRVFTANPSLGGGGGARKTILPLKRTESIHRLSLTLNDDSSNQKQTLSVLHLSQLSGGKLRQMSSSKVKATATATTTVTQSATTAKLNLLSPKSNASSSTSTGGSAGGGSTSSASGHSKPAAKAVGNSKKKSLGKLGKTESIENQYRSMIHRQLLETSCNTQLAKRQLHIFMPNPKLGGSSNSVTPHAQSQNDCDSCLTSLISEDVSRP